MRRIKESSVSGRWDRMRIWVWCRRFFIFWRSGSSRRVDRLLGREEGEDLDLITFVTDRVGHDMRYAIDSSKLQRELGWESSLQFEEGIKKTVRWYLDNQEWMNNVTSGDYQKYYEEMYIVIDRV